MCIRSAFPALVFSSLALVAACTPSEKPPSSATAAADMSPGLDDVAGTPQPAPPSSNGDELSVEVLRRVREPWTGDLDAMKDRRYVRMLVAFSRTNYFVDNARQNGLTYEAGRLLETFLNGKLRTGNTPLHVAFIPVSRDRLFQDLAQGRGDIAAANLTVTSHRQGLVDFAPPFLTGVREMVVTTVDEPAVARPEDLSGRTVHVRRSSSYFESLTALNRALASAGKAPVRIVEAPEALADEDLLEMVNAGLMPATVVDDYVATFWREVFDDIRLQPAAVRSDGQVAWAVRKGTPQLHAALDQFVRAHPKGSRTFNVLYQRYLRDTAYVKNAAAESEMFKFRQLRGFFEKFGGQYDLPWLLLAAQGYQESQLDQSRKSRTGAVGVMQIKPSTARAAPIGITGVDTSAERNIHAGVKYLRFIVDEYYADEPMDRVNKGLFAVASYNAGPRRIAGLRSKAAAMGLDENQWFGNVEVVAAREIGRETVSYVSNIYKYYVSYNLVMQQAAERQRARGRRDF